MPVSREKAIQRMRGFAERKEGAGEFSRIVDEREWSYEQEQLEDEAYEAGLTEEEIATALAR